MTMNKIRNKKCEWKLIWKKEINRHQDGQMVGQTGDQADGQTDSKINTDADERAASVCHFIVSNHEKRKIQNFQ